MEGPRNTDQSMPVPSVSDTLPNIYLIFPELRWPDFSYYRFLNLS